MRKAKKTMRVLILAAAFMMILMMLPIQTVWAADEHAENTNTQATDNGDGTHSLICSECGEAVSTDNHSYDLNGTCTGCGFSAPVKATDGDTTVYYHDADTAFNAMIGKTGTITILRDQRITIAGAHDVDVVINEGVSFTISSFFQVRGRLSGLGTIIVEDEVFFGTYGIVQDVTVMSNMSVGESCQVLSGKFYGIVSNTGKILGGEFYGELINCDITGGGHIIGTVTNTSVPTAFFLGEGFLFTNQGEAIVECTSHIYNSENKCRLCGAAGYSITVTESDPNGSVSADKSAAAPEETVILTIDPDDGYVLCDLIVMCGEEWINTVYSDELGYWFAMPYGNVTVNATFTECNHGNSQHTSGTYKEENTHSFTCTLCNGTAVEKCRGDDTATCIHEGTCSVCNHSYLDLGSHNYGADGICVDCGFAAPASVTVGDAVQYYHNGSAAYTAAIQAHEAGATDVTVTILRDTDTTVSEWNSHLVVAENATLMLNTTYFGVGGGISGSGTIRMRDDTHFYVSDCTIEGVTIDGPLVNNGTIISGTFNGKVTNDRMVTGGCFNGELVNIDLPPAYKKGSVINTSDPTTFALGENFVFTNQGEAIVECTSHIYGKKDHKCRLCGENEVFDVTVTESGSNGAAPYATKETIPYGEDYEATIKTDSNAWYVNVTKVTVGGEEAAYTYDINTGLLTVETEYITSNMEITAEVYAKVTMNLNGGTPTEKAEDKLEGYKQSDGSYEVPLFYGITGESLANMAKMFVKEGCLLTGAKNAQDNDVDFTRPVENCSIILQWTPVTVSASGLTYNGERQKPTVTVGDLVEGTDYTVTYPADMTNAGEKTIVITGKGICGGSTTVNYTINKLDISGAKITVEDSLIYNGKEQTAKITQIKVGDVVLTTEDYTVSGNIGIDAKEYTLTITGKGNCTGSTDADWRIARKAVTVTAENQKIEYGNSISDSAYKAVGLIEEHEITVTLTPSTSEVTDDGTITAGAAVITANGKDITGNYDVNYLPGLLVITTSDSTKVDEPTNENVEAVERLIGQLPETVSPDDMVTAEAIETAKDAYERLTDHEKSLVEDQAKEKLKSLVAALTDYKIIIGDGGKWTKSTRKSLSFTANGPYGKFTGIKVDGKVVDKNGYESKPGSTIVTLKAEYLETLAVGRHTITVVYTDGEAEGCFEVLAEPVTPATGDDFALIQWTTIMCISVCGLIVLVVDCKRRTAE